MTEIYADIKPELKEAAKVAWSLALVQKTPMEAAQFLDMVSRYYANVLTDEEVEFLQFYFNLQMEMMKR